MLIPVVEPNLRELRIELSDIKTDGDEDFLFFLLKRINVSKAGDLLDDDSPRTTWFAVAQEASKKKRPLLTLRVLYSLTKALSPKVFAGTFGYKPLYAGETIVTNAQIIQAVQAPIREMAGDFSLMSRPQPFDQRGGVGIPPGTMPWKRHIVGVHCFTGKYLWFSKDPQDFSVTPDTDVIHWQ